MTKECILARTGIQFNLAYLRDTFDFDFQGLVTEMEKKNITIKDLGEGYQDIDKYAKESSKKEQARSEPAVTDSSSETPSRGITRYIHDIIDEIFDQLLYV